MASPHVAGVAALTRQAHPTWKVEDIKAAIVNTGDPSGVPNYPTRRGGTGLVQPSQSTHSQVIALADGPKFTVAVELRPRGAEGRLHETKSIKLHNNGSTTAMFNVAQANAVRVAAHDRPQQDGRSPFPRKARR